MGWLADGMEDEGGILFDIEQREIDEKELEDKKEFRKKRMSFLEGKYVVSTTGNSSGNQVFLQNQLVNSGGYWTKFLSNAQAFETFEKAFQERKKFRYGNPRIAKVVNGNYQWVTAEVV